MKFNFLVEITLRQPHWLIGYIDTSKGSKAVNDNRNMISEDL